MSTYYVKNGGNDNFDGLSDGNAWATVSKVNSVSFVPGDVINFNKGDEWEEQLVPATSGNIVAQIEFNAYGSGDKPIIDGIFMVLKAGINSKNIEFHPATNNQAGQVEGCNTILFEDCDFDGETNGVYSTALSVQKSGTTYSDGVTTRRCKAYNAGNIAVSPFGGGIKYSSGVRNSIIEDCECWDNIETNMQVFSSDDDMWNYNVRMRRNKIYNTLPFLAEQETGINIGWRCYDVIAERNYIYDCQVLIQFDSQSRDNIAMNNLLINGEVDMIRFLANSVGNNTNALAFNNTLISTNGEGRAVRFRATSGGANIGHQLINNLISTTTANFTMVEDSTDGGGSNAFTSDYNLFYSTQDNGEWVIEGDTYTTIADWRTNSSQDANSVNADPLLDSNYKLKLGSPAIGAGVATGADGVDYRGGRHNSPPDIGALARNTLLKNCIIAGATIL